MLSSQDEMNGYGKTEAVWLVVVVYKANFLHVLSLSPLFQ